MAGILLNDLGRLTPYVHVRPPTFPPYVPYHLYPWIWVFIKVLLHIAR